MDWKNEVSNTATMGLPGIWVRQASMPMSAALLCRGANSANSSILAMTSSSMTTERSKYLPPCTTRCPMASMSSRESMALFGPEVSASSTTAMAALWSSMGSSMTSSLSSMPCLWKASAEPTRSQMPLASTSWVSTLTSWYFSDEEPALITRTFTVPTS